MKKLFYSVVSLLLVLSACNREERIESDLIPEVKESPRFFGVRYPAESENSISTKGVAQYAKLWHPNTTVKIKFLDGTAAYHNIVKEAADEWGQYIGLKVSFVETGNADVRITFNSGSKYISWSYIGTDCKYIRNQREATANFADWDYLESDERLTEALRIFGMILGLEMEHRHIDCELSDRYLSQVHEYWEDEITDIDWDELKEYVFDPLDRDMAIMTDVIDLESIMVWPFPIARYRPNSGYRDNDVLSENDIAFIQSLYSISPADYTFTVNGASDTLHLSYTRDAGTTILTVVSELKGVGKAWETESNSVSWLTLDNAGSVNPQLTFSNNTASSARSGQIVFRQSGSDRKLIILVSQYSVQMNGYSMAELNNTLFLGTDNGILYFDTIVNAFRKTNITSGYWLHPANAFGTVYFFNSTTSGAVYYDQAEGIFKQLSSPSTVARTSFFDEISGTLYVGAQSGLWGITENSPYSMRLLLSSSRTIYSVFRYKDKIYYGEWANALRYLNGSGSAVVQGNAVDIRAFIEFEGKGYVGSFVNGSTMGIFKFDETGTSCVQTNWVQSTGSGNVIYKGTLYWGCTRNGIVKLAPGTTNFVRADAPSSDRFNRFVIADKLYVSNGALPDPEAYSQNGIWYLDESDGSFKQTNISTGWYNEGINYNGEVFFAGAGMAYYKPADGSNFIRACYVE